MKEIFLIGNPLGHSWSAEIHSRFEGYTYALRPLETDEVEGFMKGGGYDGLNVTIPYKLTAMQYLDEISPEAERIGAVNTVVKKNGRLFGYNTDYTGFSYLLGSSGIDVSGKKVLVLGSGGSSHTVCTVLDDKGAKEAVVISRSGSDNYENLSRHADADIIINTTPLGMYPNNGVSPVRLDEFPRLSAVVDLIYNPERTALILDAEERGIRTASGLTMLVSQAKASAELFTGAAIPEKKIGETVASLRREKRNIVLIGMPGCGKTTVGRALAELTGRKFADTDELISEKYARTPEEIIKSDGENAFRACETEVLRETAKESSLVISTGGGAVTRRDNIRLMRQNGTVVFLNRPIGELSSDGRPLSEAFGAEKLWKERASLYKSAADISVDADKSAAATAKEILERLMK